MGFGKHNGDQAEIMDWLMQKLHQSPVRLQFMQEQLVPKARGNSGSILPSGGIP
jgi:hypothetical protein